MLFSAIKSITNPPARRCFDLSLNSCEDFKRLFSDKVENIRLRSLCTFLSPFLWPSSIISGMKPTTCCLDIVPTKLLNKVFGKIGLHILNVINSSSYCECPTLVQICSWSTYSKWLQTAFKASESSLSTVATIPAGNRWSPCSSQWRSLHSIG